jgi:hypothetical protein
VQGLKAIAGKKLTIDTKKWLKTENVAIAGNKVLITCERIAISVG